MATEQDGTGVASNTKSVWGPQTLVQVVLGFWAVWLSLVFLTNFSEGLVQLGVLGDGWTFASGNYGFLLDVAGTHETPESVVALLFLGGVVWELVAAALMWNAFAGSVQGIPSKRRIYRAFIPTTGFFAAFLVLTEVFLAYGLADTHVRLFIAALVSLFVVDRLMASD